MNKKLQVFISSTFIDLQEERQSAVEAILKAGHIPAGMELFKAGNQSQWDTITRWIDESDIYMLILGGRYGTVEETSKKSYTHLEYEYALSKNIPIFAVTLTEGAIQSKVEQLGYDKALERDNNAKYKEFKETVRSRMCTDVTDVKDIKLAVLDSLADLQRLNKFTGWMSGKDMPDVNSLNKQIINLQQENMLLMKENLKSKETIEKLKLQQKKKEEFNGFSFEELVDLLRNETVTLPNTVFTKETTYNLLELFILYSTRFATGVTNSGTANKQVKYFYFHVAPLYMKYDLMEKVKASGVQYHRIQTSKTGHKFLGMLHKELELHTPKQEIDDIEE